MNQLEQKDILGGDLGSDFGSDLGDDFGGDFNKEINIKINGLDSNLNKEVNKTPASSPRVKKTLNSQTSCFQMSDFELPGIFLLIGTPKRGKSYLTRFLIKNFFKLKSKGGHASRTRFKFGRVYTGTQNEDYHFLPEKAVHIGYSPDELEKWLKFLDSKHLQLNGGNPRGKKKLPSNFIVFDDLLGKLNNDNMFKFFISRFRHYNTTVFLCSQRLKTSTSGTNIRDYANYVFLFATNGAVNLKTYYEYWFSEYFETLAEFKEHFRKCTGEKYHAIFWHDRDVDGLPNCLKFKAGEVNDKPIKF